MTNAAAVRKVDDASAVRMRLVESADNLQKLGGECAEVIAAAAAAMTAALRRGNKVLFCGNGGSAADSQHLAAELMGRFLRDRAPLPALALTVDTSALTAIGNDYGYAEVFARQLAGVGAAGDVLVAISTSGNSVNVVRAAEAARERGITVIAMTGAAGGGLAELADVTLAAPAARTDLIQEMHIAAGHVMCGLVEAAMFGDEAGRG